MNEKTFESLFLTSFRLVFGAGYTNRGANFLKMDPKVDLFKNAILKRGRGRIFEKFEALSLLRWFKY